LLPIDINVFKIISYDLVSFSEIAQGLN
jgi:hypothetical protein